MASIKFFPSTKYHFNRFSNSKTINHTLIILSENYLYCLQVHQVLLQLYLSELLSTTFCQSAAHRAHLIHVAYFISCTIFFSRNIPLSSLYEHTLPSSLFMKSLGHCSPLNILSTVTMYMILEIISKFCYFKERENENQRSLVMQHDNFLTELIQNKAQLN